MARYLMGIDNGLTVSKAAIFDLEGHEVAVAGRKTDISYPHPGWTERDMDTLWRSTAGAIREALSKAGVRPSDILAVGNSGHGNGLYLLDRAGRSPAPGYRIHGHPRGRHRRRMVSHWRA